MKGKTPLAALAAALALMFALAPIAGSAVYSPAKASAMRLYINGPMYAANPYVKDQTVMVPLRVIAELGGYKYSHKGGTSTLSGNGEVYTATVGKARYTAGGVTYSLSASPEITDDKFYIPVAFLTGALGMAADVTGNDVFVTTGTARPTDLPKPDNALKPVSGKLAVLFNGKKTGFTAYFTGNTLMMPLRGTANGLGYNYKSFSKGKYSTLSNDYVTYKIYWGRNQFPVKGSVVKLERAATTKGNVLYVPSSFITKELGAKIAIKGKKVLVTK